MKHRLCAPRRAWWTRQSDCRIQIRKVLGSNLRSQLSPFKANDGAVLQLSCDRFLTHPLQFIMNLPATNLTQHRYCRRCSVTHIQGQDPGREGECPLHFACQADFPPSWRVAAALRRASLRPATGPRVGRGDRWPIPTKGLLRVRSEGYG
jgi:hypothetical protein